MRHRLTCGIRPSTAQPMDDDLLRPWRSWWSLGIWRGLPTRRSWWVRQAGSRNPIRMRSRYWFLGRAFYYFSGSGLRARSRGSRR